MPDHAKLQRERDNIVRRQWLPLVAFAFVIAALAALVASPFIMVQRLEGVRDSASATMLPRLLSLALGVLALVAAAITIWFAFKRRALTTALANAMVEESRLRAEAEQQRTELQRVSESKNRLLRGFSHDVKNPLGAADGYLQLLQDGLMGEMTEKQSGAVGKARRSLAAALRLIEDLLELARAEVGEIEIESVPVDVCAVVRETADEYEAQAHGKGLALELDLPPTVPKLVSDPARVRQVLSNLLSNAVKYTERGRVTIRLRKSDGGKLGIEVADTGPGIAEDKRSLIFQEFVRLDPHSSRGSGVGLAISSRIVSKLGGEITLDSREGVGSTFVLWLPTRADGETSCGPPGNGTRTHAGAS